MDPTLKQYLGGMLSRTTPPTAKLVRDVLAECVYERVDHTPSKRVDHTLHRLEVLSKQALDPSIRTSKYTKCVVWVGMLNLWFKPPASHIQQVENRKAFL